MRAPDFWWRARAGLRARLLQPLGWLYGLATLSRMRRAGAEAGIPVICVGNFIAGGAGKTPTALALGQMLAARGETPFILSRGYGGTLPGPAEVDLNQHDATQVGDEPLLMAGRYRTVIARDRPAGAALARANGASVIVMDDGLQNPSLTKRLRLAVVDGASGTGNGLCLPAGPLRAPLAGQLGETDAVIVISAGNAGAAIARVATAAGRAVLTAKLEPTQAASSALNGQTVLALSGIGRPEKFLATLRGSGANIVSERRYGDHHAYSAADIDAILAEAKAADCLIATTEKDMTKLGQLWPATERPRLIVVPVTLVFDEPEAIAGLLEKALSPRC